MIYPIVAYGDPILKKRAIEIPIGDETVVQLAADMYETMYSASGVGLAAPQIGKSVRIFVVDATPMLDEDLEEEEFKQVFINPVILEEEGDEWDYEEGCLSIPNIREDITRKEKLTIRYFDENWNQKEETFDGMIARVIQHEFDHLDGVLFTDYLSPLKKRLLKKKFTNISKGKVSVSYKMRFPDMKR